MNLQKYDDVSHSIYANLITESVDLLPNVLYDDDVEFDNTGFSIWRYRYVY